MPNCGVGVLIRQSPVKLFHVREHTGQDSDCMSTTTGYDPLLFSGAGRSRRMPESKRYRLTLDGKYKKKKNCDERKRRAGGRKPAFKTRDLNQTIVT